MDTVTTLSYLSPWLIWLVVEVIVLVQRIKPPRPRTISMVARDLRYHTSSVIFMWFGLAAHWWWLSESYTPAWMQVAFWLLGTGLLAFDIVTAQKPWQLWPKWMLVAKDPRLMAVLGLVAGKVLFPQV